MLTVLVFKSFLVVLNVPIRKHLWKLAVDAPQAI